MPSFLSMRKHHRHDEQKASPPRFGGQRMPSSRRSLVTATTIAGATLAAIALALLVEWALTRPENFPAANGPSSAEQGQAKPSTSLERASAQPSWPTGANTGVPAGTTLRPSGSITVTTPGAVIDSLLVTGTITVLANNVTIMRTKVVGDGIFNGDDAYSGTKIIDTEIDGQKRSGYTRGISYSDYSCVRCNIHGVGQGIAASNNVELRDSWIHDLIGEGDPANGGSHNEAVLSNGGTNITVVNNRLDSGSGPQFSSSLSLYGDFAPVRDVLVQGNLFNGGGYCVYAGSAPGKPYPVAFNTRFIDNSFGRSVFAKCGYYGPATAYQAVNGNQWLGNRWQDGSGAVDVTQNP